MEGIKGVFGLLSKQLLHLLPSCWFTGENDLLTSACSDNLLCELGKAIFKILSDPGISLGNCLQVGHDEAFPLILNLYCVQVLGHEDKSVVYDSQN